MKYEEPTGKQREYGFARRYVKEDHFEKDGGAEYNFDRQLN